MKNIRMSKKNPSKILKIIEAPHSSRYTSQDNSHLNQLALGSTSKTHRLANIYINKEQRISSPSHSQRFIEFGSLELAKKTRSKSLNRSQEMIKKEEKDSVRLVLRQSIELRPRNEYSPYIRKTKIKESDKFLNFKSVNLG